MAIMIAAKEGRSYATEEVRESALSAVFTEAALFKNCGNGNPFVPKVGQKLAPLFVCAPSNGRRALSCFAAALLCRDVAFNQS
jgi:hypothetical protein